MSETNEKKAVFTRNETYKNGETIYTPSAMVVTYSDDMVRIEFSPELPEMARTNERRYDYENKIVTAISRKNCNLLYKKYIEEFLPKLVDKEDYNVGVVVADVNLITLGTGVVDGEVHPYIALFKNLNKETLTPESAIYYEFRPSEVIVNYDKNSGSFGNRQLIHSELDMFMEDLHSHVTAGSKAFVHESRVVDKTYKDIISDKLDKIGSKLGLDLSFKPNNAGYKSGYGSVFNKPSNNGPVPTIVADDFDDLPF